MVSRKRSVQENKDLNVTTRGENFNKQVSVRHPTVSKFLRKLRKEQASNELSTQHATIGIDISMNNEQQEL